MSIEVLFYTQIISIVGFVIAVFVLYRILVQQKDSTIELLKEKVNSLKEKLDEAKQNTPDALAKSLSDRVTILDAEIERLSKDKEQNQEEINKKEIELSEVRQEAEKLSREIAKAHEFMDEFFCPYCKAPMAERNLGNETIEYNGREIDIDHEHILYECGLELVDGSETNPCESDEERDSSSIIKS